MLLQRVRSFNTFDFLFLLIHLLHVRNMDAAIPGGRDTLFSPGTSGAAAAAAAAALPLANKSTASGGGLCRDGGLCSISRRLVVSDDARAPDAEDARIGFGRRPPAATTVASRLDPIPLIGALALS